MKFLLPPENITQKETKLVLFCTLSTHSFLHHVLLRQSKTLKQIIRTPTPLLLICRQNFDVDLIKKKYCNILFHKLKNYETKN
jgi:hypothetical protein